MKLVYLVVGCPGAGKTWVCQHASRSGGFTYVPHDSYADEKSYVQALIQKSRKSTLPLLGEIPFGLSQIEKTLEQAGLKPVPVFIIEHRETIQSRYFNREQSPIPQGHLSRQETYLKRAYEKNAFYGSSREVLEYLKHHEAIVSG